MVGRTKFNYDDCGRGLCNKADTEEKTRDNYIE